MNILKWFKKEKKVTEKDLMRWHVKLVLLRQEVSEAMEFTNVYIKNKKSKEHLDGLFMVIDQKLSDLEEGVSSKLR